MPPLGPTQPVLHCIISFSPGVKRSESKADHSPPSSCDVRNVWSCSFTPTCHSYRPKGFKFIGARSCRLPSPCYRLYFSKWWKMSCKDSEGNGPSIFQCATSALASGDWKISWELQEIRLSANIWFRRLQIPVRKMNATLFRR